MEDASKPVERPGRGIWLIVSPCAVFAAIVMYLFFDQRGWSTSDIIFEAMLVLASICLILAAVDPRTFWWAPRVLAFMIFALYLSYLAYELLTQPFTVPRSRAEANPLNAIAGFCFFGIPCLLYALSGRDAGSGTGEIADPGSMARLALYQKIAAGARLVLLGVSVVVVAAIVIRALAR